jgi:beta-phosphoglucomutase-like phosphatase (HAD superfamily)
LKAVLFDIDGTIADSDPIHFLAFQEILSEVSIIFPFLPIRIFYPQMRIK